MRDPHYKRVLVTGGAGFLGAHLCRVLLGQGHEVLCADNLSTGSRRNIAALMANPAFELVRHDVTLPLFVEVDEIYNLACPASPRHYQFDPLQTTRTNVFGAFNMLGLARRLKATILQASTSEVYGDPETHPQPENYCGRVNPIGLRACYDEGKRCAETIFMEYRRQHAVDIRIGRIFNTYGPGMHPRDGRVVSNFITQALRNAPMTIYGDGRQTRSFCYVDDTIEALLRLMQAPGGSTSGPVNIGNPEEVSMLELAETIRTLAGSRSAIVFQAAASDDPARRRPDITLAQNILDWSPRIDLRTGLAPTIAHFRAQQEPVAR
jgi:UDP-glucuronate decarboxylase